MSPDVSPLRAMPSVLHLIRNIPKGHRQCVETGQGHASAADTSALEGTWHYLAWGKAVYWSPLKKLSDVTNVIYFL